VSADLTRANQWIWETLTGDNIITVVLGVGQRIYFDMAPQATATYRGPFIMVTYLGGADKVQTSRTRLTNALYLIRAVRVGSAYSQIEAIADRIEDVLTVPDTGTIVRDTRISSCIREQPHQRTDAEGGIPTVYLGGFYRIKFQPAEF
jgi:hypothetical protein